MSKFDPTLAELEAETPEDRRARHEHQRIADKTADRWSALLILCIWGPIGLSLLFALVKFVKWAWMF